jgi:hypothetical protein
LGGEHRLIVISGEITANNQTGAAFQRLIPTGERSGLHFVVRADEELTTFMELESAIRER